MAEKETTVIAHCDELLGNIQEMIEATDRLDWSDPQASKGGFQSCLSLHQQTLKMLQVVAERVGALPDP